MTLRTKPSPFRKLVNYRLCFSSSPLEDVKSLRPALTILALVGPSPAPTSAPGIWWPLGGYHLRSTPSFPRGRYRISSLKPSPTFLF